MGNRFKLEPNHPHWLAALASARVDRCTGRCGPLERRGGGVVSPASSLRIPIEYPARGCESRPRLRERSDCSGYEPYANETAKDEGFAAIGFDKTFYPYNATVADEAWGSLFDFFGKYL